MAEQNGWKVKLIYSDISSHFGGFEEKKIYLPRIIDDMSSYLKQFNAEFEVIGKVIFKMLRDYNHVEIRVEDLLSRQSIFKGSIKGNDRRYHYISKGGKEEENYSSEDLKKHLFEVLEMIKNSVRQYYQLYTK